MDCDELTHLLVASKIPALKSSFLVDNKDIPLYLVHFDRGKINLHVLMNQHKAVGNLIVRWERFNRSRKRLTQCRNCQMFGHSASNCGHNYRCVKCTDDHNPGDCKRKSREDSGSPKCVNCGGDHTANSRVCSCFITYQKKVERQRVNRKAIAEFKNDSQASQQDKKTQPAPWNSSKTDFPALPALNSQNVSMNRQGSLHSQGQKLSSLQSRLAAIDGIQNSLKIFEAFVTRLESAKSEVERQNIIFSHLVSANGY